MFQLWFETHSSSVDNERGVASGHLDVPLSEEGRRQAAKLGARYAERSLAIVYASDLKRASMTAEIAFAGRSLPIRQDRRLRECDYGTWAGSPIVELDAARPRFVDEPFPGGESFRDVVRRVEAFLDDLNRAEGPVLVVGHRASWYALEHLIHGKDLKAVVSARWNWQPGWKYTRGTAFIAKPR